MAIFATEFFELSVWMAQVFDIRRMILYLTCLQVEKAGQQPKIEEEEEEEENMVRRRWFCTGNAKSLLVKIVHPGGHIELHDSPILAAQIMHRNPKCCVAYPHVFQQPWAIVAPDTVLMLGEKFYVVPINTVRKLQRLSLRYSPSALSRSASPSFPTLLTMRSKELLEEGDEGDGHTKNDSLKSKSEDGECFSKDGCLVRLLKGLNVKDKHEEWTEGSQSSNSFGSSDTGELMRRKWRGNTGRRASKVFLTKRRSSIDWRPSLESIKEEKSTSNL